MLVEKGWGGVIGASLPLRPRTHVHFPLQFSTHAAALPPLQPLPGVAGTYRAASGLPLQVGWGELVGSLVPFARRAPCGEVAGEAGWAGRSRAVDPIRPQCGSGHVSGQVMGFAPCTAPCRHCVGCVGVCVAICPQSHTYPGCVDVHTSRLCALGTECCMPSRQTHAIMEIGEFTRFSRLPRCGRSARSGQW